MNRKPRWSFLLVALTCFMLVGMAALARADTPLSPGRLVFTAVLPDGSQVLYTGAPDGPSRGCPSPRSRCTVASGIVS